MHEYADVKCKPSHLKDSRGFQQMKKCSLLPLAEQKKRKFPLFLGFCSPTLKASQVNFTWKRTESL